MYRKDDVLAIGGFPLDTETEDLELVVRLHEHLGRAKRKYRVVFVPDPVCWTEAPVTLKILRRQRTRWHRGLVRCLWRHKRMMLNPRYGSVGLFAFPYFFFFEMLGPFIEVAGYVAVVLSYLLGILNTWFFLLFLAAAILYGVFLSVAAILLEEISFRRYPSWLDLTKLLVFGILENFGPRQVLSFFKIQAFWGVLMRRRAWGRMERTGFREAKKTTQPVGARGA